MYLLVLKLSLLLLPCMAKTVLKLPTPNKCVVTWTVVMQKCSIALVHMHLNF